MRRYYVPVISAVVHEDVWFDKAVFQNSVALLSLKPRLGDKFSYIFSKRLPFP
jgi:hypothetical protein